MRTSTLTVNQLCELALPSLRDSSEAFLLVDDRVSDKRYRRSIDVAKHPYPSNAHGMVTGIELVKRAHSSGEADDFLPTATRALTRATRRPGAGARAWQCACKKCPCRKAAARRNHWTSGCVAGMSLRQHARRMGQPSYQAPQQQWATSLRQLPQKTRIQALVWSSA